MSVCLQNSRLLRTRYSSLLVVCHILEVLDQVLADLAVVRCMLAVGPVVDPVAGSLPMGPLHLCLAGHIRLQVGHFSADTGHLKAVVVVSGHSVDHLDSH